MLLGAFFVVALGTVIVDQADDYIYEVSRDPVVATITGHIGAGDALTPVNSVGERLQSNELNAQPARSPSAPRNLQASPGDAYINLTWQEPSRNVPAITNYNLYRGTTSGGGTLFLTLGNVLAYTNTGLTNGQTYYYRVSAVNRDGESRQSNEASAVPAALTIVPSDPSLISAMPGNALVVLNWTAPSSNGGSVITNYAVYRGTTSGGETLLITVGNVLTHTNTELTNGQIYYYKVSAVNSVGEGLQSNELNATPVGPPTAPQNLQANPGDAYINLTWQAPASNGGSAVTGYEFYRGAISGGETLLMTLNNVLTYTDTSLTNGQIYYYKVSAVNSIGEGAQSDEVSAAPVGVPTAPLGLQAVAGDSAVDLNWTTPSYVGPGTLTYHLFRDGILLWSGTAIVYHDASLMRGVQYSYKVAANNSLGLGPNCTVASATPFGVPSTPRGLTATIGDRYVILNWTSPEYTGPGTLVYHLFRNESQIWNGTSPIYADTNVTNGVAYTYKVAANNSAGWGSNCTDVQATPQSGDNIPTAPRELTATSGNSFVDLSWTVPSYTGPRTLTYHLFRNGLEVWNGTGLTYSDIYVINGVTYSYKVAASNSVGWGPNSNSVQATPTAVGAVPPGAPTNFHATAGDGSVSLSWSAPESNGSTALLGYRIYRGTSLTSMKFLPTPATVTTYTDTGLTNGQIYYYKVCAYSSAGNSTMSDTLDATPSSGVVGNNTLFYVGIAAIVLVFVAGVSVAIWNARR